MLQVLDLIFNNLSSASFDAEQSGPPGCEDILISFLVIYFNMYFSSGFRLFLLANLSTAIDEASSPYSFVNFNINDFALPFGDDGLSKNLSIYLHLFDP